MPLPEAYALLERIHLHSQDRDVRDDELIEAFALIVAAHPEARPALIAYWRTLEYRPDLDVIGKSICLAQCVPALNRVWMACRRQWTVRGWEEG
jgi:hypothetical protein